MPCLSACGTMGSGRSTNCRHFHALAWLKGITHHCAVLLCQSYMLLSAIVRKYNSHHYNEIEQTCNKEQVRRCLVTCNVNLGTNRGVFFQDLGWRGGFFFRMSVIIFTWDVPLCAACGGLLMSDAGMCGPG